MGTSMSNLGQTFAAGADIGRSLVMGTVHSVIAGDSSGYDDLGDQYERLGGHLSSVFTNTDSSYNNFSSKPYQPSDYGPMSASSSSWDQVKGYSGSVNGAGPGGLGNMNGMAASMAKNATYGRQAGMSGVTPPSDLNKISDPNTKLSMAVSRGAYRSTLNTGNNLSDVQSANTLANAVQPSAATPPS